MPINRALIQTAYEAISFADDVRALYTQLQSMTAKINRYMGGAEPTFNAAVDALVSPEDLTRVAALLTDLAALQTNLETNYSDFVNPQ